MTRKKAWKAIKAERKVQDAIWGGLEHDSQHTAAEWASFINKRTKKLQADELSFGAERKWMIEIAALALAALEASDEI